MARLLLTLATLALTAAGYALMLKGWRSRQRRQALLPEPWAPTGTADPLLPEVPGLFVGTTDARDWLDRIVVHHLADRAEALLRVATDGVHLHRAGLDDLFLPWSCLESVTVETSLAGKVVSSGMLLLGWRLGDRSVVSAFRADDRSAHEPLRRAISSHLPLEART
jgi:hypothetical protein